MRYGMLVILAACAAVVPAAGPETTTAPATGPTKNVLKLKHLTVDLKARKIVMDAEVCKRTGAIELLVCKWGTKDYESILRTKAEPAHLHAALLALGLAPGKPARWLAGKAVPPRGAELKITLQWKDKAGNNNEVPAGKWLKQAGKRRISPPEKWVFVGSMVLEKGGYWADAEGDVISVSNFASSVIDVPFKSTDDNAALEFAANKQAVPPTGTAVKVVISPLPGAERADHARAMLEIDHLGRMQLDGKPVVLTDLPRWAGKFINKHARAMVFIRAAGLALVNDVNVARQELRLGGIREFDVERVGMEGEVLPRTASQCDWSLKDWAHRFAHADDYIVPPETKARATLEQIDRQLKEMEARKELWLRYRADLRKALDAYEAAKPPAQKDADTE